MKISRKIIVLLIILTLSYAFFVAQSMSQEKKVLRVAVKVSDVRSLDPHHTTGTADVICVDAMFNSLLRFPPGTVTFDMNKVQGGLAERWEVSRDGLVWTFYLRKEVKFHKGYGELTSEDVKFSLEKAANPQTSIYANLYKALEKVEAPDRYVLRITLKYPVPSIMTMLYDFRGGLIVSKKAVLEKGDKFKFDPIGTGPFMFESYTAKEKAVMVRNPDYFEGRPLLDVFEVWLMPDAASREMAFRAGQIDICEGMREQAWVNKMKTIPQTVIDIFGPGEYGVLYFNVTKKPFDDIRVRQAFNYGVNQEEVMDFLGRDLTVKMISPIPPNFWGYSDKVPTYPYDLSKAKQLLKEAGYPEGFKLEMVMTENEDTRRPMEQIQEQLRRMGIDVKLNVTSHSIYHERIRKDVNLMNYYSALDLPIADSIFQRFWHSRSVIGKPTASVNFSHYENVDKEIEMGEKDPDPKKKLEYWAAAQRKIMEDAACKPISIVKFPWARKSYVKLGYELLDSLPTTPRIMWKTDILK